MRMLVICLCLGILLLHISPKHSPSLFAVIGFLVIMGLTFARLCKRFGLPTLLGPLVAGLALGSTNLITVESLGQMTHTYNFALAWVGLFLGIGITPKLISNRRLTLGATALYFPPVILIFAYLLFQSHPPSQAISVAILAGIPVILLVPEHSKIGGETVPLAKLATAMGLVFWALFNIDRTALFGEASLHDIALEIALFCILLEATVQICKTSKGNIAQHLTLFGLAYLLALANHTRDLSMFFLTFPAGIYLSFRKTPTPLLKTPALSEAILCFVLIVFSLKTVYQSTHFTLYPQLTTLGFYFLTLIAAKTLGGALAQHFLRFPPKVWLSLLPQGFIALVCFQFTPTFTPFNTGYLVGIILLAATYPICSKVWTKIKKDPLIGRKPSQQVF